MFYSRDNDEVLRVGETGRHLLTQIMVLGLLVSCQAVVTAQSFASSFDTVSQCNQPTPPKNAVLADTIRLQEQRTFPMFVRVRFICKVGFEPTKTSVMMSLCMAGGKWNPDPRQSSCRRKNLAGKCDSDEFRCKKDNKCIPADRRCDCRQDCVDGSDERTCERPRQVILAGSSTDQLQGTIGSPGFRFNYPKKFKCYYMFVAQSNQRFIMQFNQFDLLRPTFGTCRDYVSLYDMEADALNTDSASSSREGARKYCGTDDVPEFTSKSYIVTMLVDFSSGKSLSKETRALLQGFSMEWKVVPATTAVVSYPTGRQGNSSLGRDAKPKSRLVSGRTNQTAQYLTMILLPIALSLGVPVALLLLICCRSEKSYSSIKATAKAADTCLSRHSVVELCQGSSSEYYCRVALPPHHTSRYTDRNSHNSMYKEQHLSADYLPRVTVKRAATFSGETMAATPQSRTRSEVLPSRHRDGVRYDPVQWQRTHHKKHRVRAASRTTAVGESDSDYRTQFYTLDDVHRSSATGTDDTPISGFP